MVKNVVINANVLDAKMKGLKKNTPASRSENREKNDLS
jgi:hypothetical protein